MPRKCDFVVDVNRTWTIDGKRLEETTRLSFILSLKHSISLSHDAQFSYQVDTTSDYLVLGTTSQVCFLVDIRSEMLN